MVGYPLIHEELRLGALNVYADSRQSRNDDLDVLGVFADMATAYLVRTVQLAETEKSPNNCRALDSRVLLEQAKGVLAKRIRDRGRRGLSANSTAQPEPHVKLLEVCRQVVNHGLKLPDTD